MCVEVLCIPKGVTCSYQVNSMCTRSLYQTQQDLTYSCFFSCRFQFLPASHILGHRTQLRESESNSNFCCQTPINIHKSSTAGLLALFHTMGDCWALSHFFWIRLYPISTVQQGFFFSIYTTFTLCCTYQSFVLGLFKHSSVSCSVGLRGVF